MLPDSRQFVKTNEELSLNIAPAIASPVDEAALPDITQFVKIGEEPELYIAPP